MKWIEVVTNYLETYKGIVDIAALHPAIVHFAIVLPLFAFIFQLVFLTTKNSSYSKVATSLLTLGAIFMVMAFLSGKMAGPDVKPLLNDEAKKLFDIHMKLGLGLSIFYIVLVFLKTIAIFIKKRGFRFFVGTMMLVGACVILYQGKIGGELVYNHAAGVEVPDCDEEEQEQEKAPQKQEIKHEEVQKTPQPPIKHETVEIKKEVQHEEIQKPTQNETIEIKEEKKEDTQTHQSEEKSEHNLTHN